MIKLEKTKKFFEEIKTMGLFKRIFSWTKIISLLTESYAEIDKVYELENQINDLNTKKQLLEKDILNYNIELKKQNEIIIKMNLEIQKINDENNEKQSLIATLKETKTQNLNLITKQKEDIIRFENKINILENEIKKLDKENKEKQSLIDTLQETKNQNYKENLKLIENNKFLDKLKSDLENKILILEKKITGFEKIKEEQQNKFNERILTLEKREQTLEDRRKEIEQEKINQQAQKFENMKKNWKNHEDKVEQKIRSICNKYVIEYLDKEKVPFKGKPDNTLKIANEFVIFDAKCPKDDNLSNFANYIKSQTEIVKKYIKEQDVKKDVFLVIPTNTLEIIDTLFYDLSDYRVHIISLDSIEPIILSLKKIEEYEFAQKLSPEDRDAICRILGQFTHHTKRRLQIDTYLAERSLDLLNACVLLPNEIITNSKNHELNSIINVPMDKRNKKVGLDRFINEKKKLIKEIQIQNINTNQEDLKKIEEIKLHEDE